MTEVAWTPVSLSDAMHLLRSRGASQVVLAAASRVRLMRKSIDELRSEGRPPLTWLQSRPSQLAVFYALLANWYSDRETILVAHDVDYGGDQ